jgi:hypothetical protein
MKAIVPSVSWHVAALSHLPSVFIIQSSKPLAAAVVAAPILKLWLLNFEWSKPARVRHPSNNSCQDYIFCSTLQPGYYRSCHIHMYTALSICTKIKAGPIHECSRRRSMGSQKRQPWWEKAAPLTNKTVDNSSFMANSGRISSIGPQVCCVVTRDGVFATLEAITVARFAEKK